MVKAPDFSLLDQENRPHRLSDYRGKWVVLYFYPRDNTPGCTKEACGFRDTASEFQKRNAVVLGVSKDSVATHTKFATKYRLNFPILSDEDKKVIKAYGAWGQKKFLGKTFEGMLRKTVLIDPKGNISKRYEKVNPMAHPQVVLSDIKLQEE